MQDRWPTRREWAERRRDPLSQDHEFDRSSQHFPADQLDRYASPAEIAQAIEELRRALVGARPGDPPA